MAPSRENKRGMFVLISSRVIIEMNGRFLLRWMRCQRVLEQDLERLYLLSPRALNPFSETAQGHEPQRNMQ